MVLLSGIEPPTSSLPMTCSTPELRQRVVAKRLLRFRGHTVIGDVHLGDWGLQMGHLITELQDEEPELPYFDESYSGDYPSQSPVSMTDLARLYPAASNKAKADPARMERSRLATAELQAGRAGYRALLDHFITVSIAALKTMWSFCMGTVCAYPDKCIFSCD